jgi:hypothetical protein
VFTPRSFLFLVSSPFLYYFDHSFSHNSFLSYQTFFPFLLFCFVFTYFSVCISLSSFLGSPFIPSSFHSLILRCFSRSLSFTSFFVLSFLFIFFHYLPLFSLFYFCLFAFLHLFCPFCLCFVLLPLTLSHFLFSSFFLSLHGDEFFQWEKRNKAIAYIEKCQTGLRSICQEIFFACLKSSILRVLNTAA